MLTRRLFLLSAAATLALAAASHAVPPVITPAWAQGDDTARATEFIRQASGQLTQVVNGSVPDAQKRIEMQGIVDRDVDVDAVGRFCLGRYWRTATPQQQTEYIRLFHTVLMNNITSKVGEYRGVEVTVNRAAPRDADVAVYSVVTRPNNAPADVQWIVSSAGGSPKVVDIVAEGTSLRLTQRSDYASYLAHNGNSVDALIAAMRQQVGG